MESVEPQLDRRPKIGQAIRRFGLFLLIVSAVETMGMGLGIAEQLLSPAEPYRAHQEVELAEAMAVGAGVIILSGGIIVVGNNIEGRKQDDLNDLHPSLATGQRGETEV